MSSLQLVSVSFDIHNVLVIHQLIAMTTGDCTPESPHQRPPLSEKLSGEQQQCLLQIKKT